MEDFVELIFLQFSYCGILSIFQVVPLWDFVLWDSVPDSSVVDHPYDWVGSIMQMSETPCNSNMLLHNCMKYTAGNRHAGCESRNMCKGFPSLD